MQRAVPFINISEAIVFFLLGNLQYWSISNLTCIPLPLPPYWEVTCGPFQKEIFGIQVVAQLKEFCKKENTFKQTNKEKQKNNNHPPWSIIESLLLSLLPGLSHPKSPHSHPSSPQLCSCLSLPRYCFWKCTCMHLPTLTWEGLLVWTPLPAQEIIVYIKTGHLKSTPALSKIFFWPHMVHSCRSEGV